jgi:hypothetical protein
MIFTPELPQNCRRGKEKEIIFISFLSIAWPRDIKAPSIDAASMEHELTYRYPIE